MFVRVVCNTIVRICSECIYLNLDSEVDVALVTVMEKQAVSGNRVLMLVCIVLVCLWATPQNSSV